MHFDVKAKRLKHIQLDQLNTDTTITLRLHKLLKYNPEVHERFSSN